MTASLRRVWGDRETRLRQREARYNDPSFGPRTRATRRRAVVAGVVYAALVTVFVVVVTALLQGFVNLALSLPTSLGIWWLWLERVRTSARGLTELPPELLDERQRAARAHAYERAYRLVVGGVLVLPVLAFIDRFAGLDAGALLVVGLVGVLVALAAPPVVLAWSEPSEAPADNGTDV
jgi:hypothetical protein